MTSEEVRLACLQQAVKLVIEQQTLISQEKLTFTDPLALAKTFAGFVFGFEWDEENEEYIEPEGDDSEFQATVRAFDEEGQEL